MAVNALGGQIRVAVPEGDGGRSAPDHRQPSRGRRLARRPPARRVRRAAGAHRLPLPDRGLLEHALTHKSRAAEDASGGVADNESLEFLGDAVLGLVVADTLFRQYPTLQRRAEVEGQGGGRLHAVAGAPGRGDSARRPPDSRTRRGEDRRPLQAGAARRRLRGADRGDLSRRRARGRGDVPAARAEGGDRRRQRADVRAGLQVGAAGAPAGARASAAGVPAVAARKAPTTARCSASRCGERGSARRGDRAGEEGSGAGSRPPRARVD